MKKAVFIFLSMAFVVSVFSEDMLILKSGKRFLGNVTEKDNEVIIRSKLGIVKYQKGDVEVVKDISLTDYTSEYKGEKSNLKTIAYTPVGSLQIELISGRKFIGEFYTHENQFYLKEGTTMVQINDSVIKNKAEIGSNIVKGDIISGEKCHVTLNSGRIFSGLVEEKEDGLMVTSPIGSVFVSNKYLANVEKTGLVLDLNEDKKKKAQVKQNLKTPSSSLKIRTTSSDDKRVMIYKDPNLMSNDELDKKVQDSLNKAKDKRKIISNAYDFY